MPLWSISAPAGGSFLGLRLASRVLFSALAVGCASLPAVAQAQGHGPATPGIDAVEPSENSGLPLTEWGKELALTPSQERALAELDAWLEQARGEVERLRDAEDGGWRVANEHQRKLRLELERRLGEILDPGQQAAVDLDALFDPILPTLRIRADVEVQGALPADLGHGGQFATWSSSAGVDATFALSERVVLGLGVSVSASHYHFQDAVELDPLAGDPFERLHGGQLRARLSIRATRALTLLLAGSVSSHVEEGVDLTDGLRYGGMVGFTYAFSRNLSLGLGLSVATRLEDEPRILPLPLIRLRLELTSSLSLMIGVPDGVRLVHTPTDGLEISLGIGLRGAIGIQDARLDDRGFAPGGVVRQTAIPVGVRVEWRPLPLLRLIAEGGAVVYRRFEIDDRDGHGLSDDEGEPGAFATVSVRFGF